MTAASRHTAVLALAAVLAACAGCAGAGPYRFRCEAEGGAPWREYRSAHFRVLSDASRGRVADVVDGLERIQAELVMAMAGQPAAVPGRTRVVLLADRPHFEQLAGDSRIGGYFQLAGLLEPSVVIPARSKVDWRLLAAHELTHQLSHRWFPRQPPWFAEGLAGFMESVAGENGALRGRVGAVTDPMAARFRSLPPAPARLLLEWDGSLHHLAGQHHLWSWLLYHYLWNERSPEFTAWQEQLAAGKPPAAAWRACFPDLDPSDDAAMKRLDAALGAYRKRGRFASYQVEAAWDRTLEDVGPVAPADVHMLLLGVRRDRGRSPTAWQALRTSSAEAALREDPHQPDALALLAEVQRRDATPALRAAAAARPDDWRTWLTLAGALRRASPPAPVEEQEAAFRRALALNPDAALALDGLAGLLLEAGRSGEARPLARRAVSIAPWHAAAIDTLAAVEADLGHCEQALGLQERVVDLEPSDDRFQRRFGEYQRRCGASAGPVPAVPGPAAPPRRRAATGATPTPPSSP